MKKLIFFALTFFAINAILLGCANNNTHRYRYIITDEDHKPVSGVTVSGFPSIGFGVFDLSCITASEGVCTWRLEHRGNETAATYTVSHPDYHSLGPKIDSISGYNITKDIPLTLIPYKTKVAYKFHVENNQRKPIAGSSIKAELKLAVPPSTKCITDQKGECEINFELFGKWGVLDTRIGAEGYYETKIKPMTCDKSEISKNINVVLDRPYDYLCDRLKGTGSTKKGLAPHLYDLVDVVRLQAVMQDANVEHGDLCTSTFKNKKYASIKIRHSVIYNEVEMNSYAIGVRLFDDVVRKMLDALALAPNILPLDGYDVTIMSSSGLVVPLQNELDKYKNRRSLVYQFYLPKVLVQKYKDKDITGQQLVDGSVVLLDGERIDLRLWQQ